MRFVSGDRTLLLDKRDELVAELKTMARKPVYAAGGVVIREGSRPLIAVVQRSKDDRWVLPRGKLKRGEDPRA